LRVEFGFPPRCLSLSRFFFFLGGILSNVCLFSFSPYFSAHPPFSPYLYFRFDFPVPSPPCPRDVFFFFFPSRFQLIFSRRVPFEFPCLCTTWHSACFLVSTADPSRLYSISPLDVASLSRLSQVLAWPGSGAGTFLCATGTPATQHPIDLFPFSDPSVFPRASVCKHRSDSGPYFFLHLPPSRVLIIAVDGNALLAPIH